MKAVLRVFSILTYIAMAYVGFTAVVALISLWGSQYSHFGWLIFLFFAIGSLVGILLNCFKLKWTSFFVLGATNLARVYVAYLLIQRAGLDMVVFYKQHLPALLILLFAFFSALCYQKYLKNEKGVTFQKTEKDRALREEKEEQTASDAEA